MDKGISLGLEIVPNSKEFRIMGFNAWSRNLRVKIKSRPEKGLGNAEIEKELGKIFNSKVRVVSGFSSRKKKVLILCERSKSEQILKKFRNIL